MKKANVRHTIDHLRMQPIEARRQALVFLTFFCTFLVVLLWVLTLKNRFGQEAKVETRTNAAALIKESVTKVYSDSKEESKDKQDKIYQEVGQ